MVLSFIPISAHRARYAQTAPSVKFNKRVSATSKGYLVSVFQKPWMQYNLLSEVVNHVPCSRSLASPLLHMPSLLCHGVIGSRIVQYPRSQIHACRELALHSHGYVYDLLSRKPCLSSGKLLSLASYERSNNTIVYGISGTTTSFDAWFSGLSPPPNLPGLWNHLM